MGSPEQALAFDSLVSLSYLLQQMKLFVCFSLEALLTELCKVR